MAINSQRETMCVFLSQCMDWNGSSAEAKCQVAKDETVKPLSMIAILPEPFLPWEQEETGGLKMRKHVVNRWGLYPLNISRKDRDMRGDTLWQSNIAMDNLHFVDIFSHARLLLVAISHCYVWFPEGRGYESEILIYTPGTSVLPTIFESASI